MKKYNISWVMAGIVLALLFISVIYNFKYIHITDEQRDTINQLSYKVEAQEKALELSDTIMDNNELYDTDGSDTMANYLELRDEISTISIDSMTYTYHEQ